MTISSFLYVASIFCGLMAIGNLRDLYRAEPLYSDADYLEQVENLVLAIGGWVVLASVVAFTGIMVEVLG